MAANARLAEAALTNRFGDNSNAKRLFLNFQKNIFLGLNSEETKYLDEMIILRRIIDIDRAHDNAGKKRIKHPKKYNKEIAEQKLQEMREALGDENFFEIENRADNYFDAFKFVIQRKVEEGLISLEEGIRFVNSDYSPRVFLETMFGKTGEKFSSDVISRGTNLSKAEVKKLKDGHDGDIFPDSRSSSSDGFQNHGDKDICQQIQHRAFKACRKGGLGEKRKEEATWFFHIVLQRGWRGKVSFCEV